MAGNESEGESMKANERARRLVERLEILNVFYECENCGDEAEGKRMR